MQVLFLIIKRTELVDDIMKALASIGIHGGTAIDSIGMAKSISTMDNLPTIGLLREMLKGEDPSKKGKTILVAVPDEQVEAAKETILKITGDLSLPNAGVLFGVPITFALGIN
ncbi:hypothetical protein SAMN02910317_02326 [Ruminococcaceae bacterium FB2012]|nr:hypothetical protein SAMN02910317_02326 [Ruminococcaceae bacterium FB2012]